MYNPEHFTNRELSWLAFNERVLEEALDKTNPLMERLRFLAITASNLDEFFMVRVSSLWEQAAAGVGPDASGMSPMEQLRAVSLRAHEMAEKQYDCLTRLLLPALERERICILNYSELNERRREFADAYFENTLYPVLTPMAIDQSRPFPVLNNRTVNIFIEIDDETNDGVPLYAVIQVPTVLPRFLRLPGGEGLSFILLEEIILAHKAKLFPGCAAGNTSLFRVTRNSDLVIDEDEIDDLLNQMERSIRRRRWGDPVRIETSADISDDALIFLEKALDLEAEEIYETHGPLDLSVWAQLVNMPLFEGYGKLYYKPLPPRPAAAFLGRESMFDVIRERDVLVHHPFMSFDCVLDFVREAAADPDVLAIKQTFYRVSGDSPIVAALIRAAENGKQVTVLVELKARFDEENNINWAKKLEQAGCHVVYGLTGLKTHAKLLLVVRREDDGIRRYVHLSTGNYNDATAKIYTDTGFFTCRESFGQDSSTLFNALTGYSKAAGFRKFTVSPTAMRAAFLKLIETEAQHAKKGVYAAITARMNAVSDPEIIQALYSAAAAGVRIRLLVRGICCLKTGLAGVSENIAVSGIVDRFLEHSRIFIFEHNGQPRVFLSSADWMPRNMDRRVEVMFPVEEPGLRDELINMLETSLADNVKRRELRPDGVYKKPGRRGQKQPPARSQLIFYEQADAAYNAARKDSRKEVFKS